MNPFLANSVTDVSVGSGRHVGMLVHYRTVLILILSCRESRDQKQRRRRRKRERQKSNTLGLE